MSKRRDHLVDVARQLFYERGFRATGIDTILSKAGVAKMTLYNHFGSKEALIEAALDRQDALTNDYYEAAMQAGSKDAEGQLLAAFDALSDVVHSEAFHGCFFSNAAAEFPGDHVGVHQAIARHKSNMRNLLAETARSGGMDDPDRLARRLQLLLDGAMARAHVSADADAVAIARDLAADLIRAASPGPRHAAAG